MVEKINKNDPLRQCFSNSFLAYHCHNTTQNMYTYHCHNTKHVHVSCHNTKHVHVPLSQHKTCTRILSQFKTCTRTTATTQNMYTYPVTVQNMYTYHCHNSKHVHVPLGIANIIACFQDTGFRSASLWKPQISQLLLF